MLRISRANQDQVAIQRRLESNGFGSPAEGEISVVSLTDVYSCWPSWSAGRAARSANLV